MTLDWTVPVTYRWVGKDFVAVTDAARNLIYPELETLPPHTQLSYKSALYPEVFSYRKNFERSSKRLLKLIPEMVGTPRDKTFHQLNLVQEIYKIDALGFLALSQENFEDTLNRLRTFGSGNQQSAFDRVWYQRTHMMQTKPGRQLNETASTSEDIAVKTLLKDNWLGAAIQALPEVLTAATWEAILPTRDEGRDFVYAGLVYTLIRYVWLMTEDETKADQLRPYLKVHP